MSLKHISNNLAMIDSSFYVPANRSLIHISDATHANPVSSFSNNLNSEEEKSSRLLQSSESWILPM